MIIYLSKSNRCNPNHVMLVRQAIKDHYENYDDFELLEWTGGTYSPEKLLSANFVFVVSEQDPIESEDVMLIVVGRGIYSEARQFLDEKVRDNDHGIYYCNFVDDEIFNLHQVLGAKLTNMDSWINYAKMMVAKTKSDFPSL